MSRLTIAPVSSRILQRLAGARALTSYAAESIHVCDGDEQSIPPALYPPDETERVTGVHEFSAGLEDELHLATRDHVSHSATIAWRLRNVCLANGVLCNNRSYHRLSFHRPPLRVTRAEIVSDTAAFCSSAAGNDYFAHFLLDDAATALLGEDFGEIRFGGTLRPRGPQTREYLDLFGLQYAESEQSLFRDVWLFTDHAQNSHRRARLSKLRAMLREKFVDTDDTPVYIRRGRTGTRRMLENEGAIEAQLTDRGFRIIDPEEMTAEAICRLISGSRLVVGVEGSQLAHGVLNLRAGGGLLCIQPADRFNAVYRGFCTSVGLDWGFVVADGSAERCHVPTDRLMYAIDMMLERGAPRC